MNLRKASVSFMGIGIFIAGASVGYVFSDLSISKAVSASQQVRLGEGTLINPLLECDIAVGTIDAEKINFKPELERFVENIADKTSASNIAIYFRDLNHGPTFGIHQDAPFVPASLLKVPVMMSYYRAAEKDPSLLSAQISFLAREAPQAEQTVLPAQTLTLGETYTVEELIEHMIVYSDNEALILLFRALPLEEQKHLYSLLGVDPSVITDPKAALSVKQYAAFFRILFNSSFVSEEYSEKALSLLTEIDYKNGLRAGVPDNVLVAHKFGERQINFNERHLHDCGIVYYPKHPYLLCIMTRGESAPILERAIADISDFVYKKIDNQYR